MLMNRRFLGGQKPEAEEKMVGENSVTEEVRVHVDSGVVVVHKYARWFG